MGVRIEKDADTFLYGASQPAGNFLVREKEENMEQKLIAVTVNKAGFEYDIHSLVKAF